MTVQQIALLVTQARPKIITAMLRAPTHLLFAGCSATQELDGLGEGRPALRGKLVLALFPNAEASRVRARHVQCVEGIELLG